MNNYTPGASHSLHCSFPPLHYSVPVNSKLTLKSYSTVFELGQRLYEILKYEKILTLTLKMLFNTNKIYFKPKSDYWYMYYR